MDRRIAFLLEQGVTWMDTIRKQIELQYDCCNQRQLQPRPKNINNGKDGGNYLRKTGLPSFPPQQFSLKCAVFLPEPICKISAKTIELTKSILDLV
eukprot:15364707-Ditylum_brightwellii.AAC.1